MPAGLIFGSFAVYLALTIPIGVSIGLAVVTYLWVSGRMPLIYLANNLFSSCDSFPLMAIPFFILAGSLMEGGGLSRRLVNFANSIVGHVPGGLAIVAVLTSLFFGAISGSSPATVAAVGGVIVPFMLKEGYPVKFTLGLMSASGCLGVIIPPSIPMIMYGVATGASVGNLFLCGILPGILCGTGLSILAYFICKKHQYQDVSNIHFSISNVFREFRNAIWALLVPFIILGGIYGGFFTPTEAAVVAVVYGLFAGIFIYKELNWKNIVESISNSTLTTASVLIIVGTGTTLGKILAIERIPYIIVEGMQNITSSPIVLLLLINIFLLVVGCLMETIAAILILAPILFPLVNAYGIDTLHFGIIMVVNLAIGFVTPPVGVNLFTAKNLAKGATFEQVVVGVLPFLVVLLISLMLITYVPDISLLLLKVLGKI